MKEYQVKVYPNGDKEWWLNGQRHREDGPAIECANGTKSWWLNGLLHREDGPALEWAGGTKEWWLNGKEFTEEEFKHVANSCTDRVIEIDGKKYKLTAI